MTSEVANLDRMDRILQGRTRGHNDVVTKAFNHEKKKKSDTSSHTSVSETGDSVSQKGRMKTTMTRKATSDRIGSQRGRINNGDRMHGRSGDGEYESKRKSQREYESKRGNMKRASTVTSSKKGYSQRNSSSGVSRGNRSSSSSYEKDKKIIEESKASKERIAETKQSLEANKMVDTKGSRGDSTRHHTINGHHASGRQSSISMKDGASGHHTTAGLPSHENRNQQIPTQQTAQHDNRNQQISQHDARNPQSQLLRSNPPHQITNPHINKMGKAVAMGKPPILGSQLGFGFNISALSPSSIRSSQVPAWHPEYNKRASSVGSFNIRVPNMVNANANAMSMVGAHATYGNNGQPTVGNTNVHNAAQERHSSVNIDDMHRQRHSHERNPSVTPGLAPIKPEQYQQAAQVREDERQAHLEQQQQALMEKQAFFDMQDQQPGYTFAFQPSDRQQNPGLNPALQNPSLLQNPVMFQLTNVFELQENARAKAEQAHKNQSEQKDFLEKHMNKPNLVVPELDKRRLQCGHKFRAERKSLKAKPLEAKLDTSQFEGAFLEPADKKLANVNGNQLGTRNQHGNFTVRIEDYNRMEYAKTSGEFTVQELNKTVAVTAKESIKNGLQESPMKKVNGSESGPHAHAAESLQAANPEVNSQGNGATASPPDAKAAQGNQKSEGGGFLSGFLTGGFSLGGLMGNNNGVTTQKGGQNGTMQLVLPSTQHYQNQTGSNMHQVNVDAIPDLLAIDFDETLSIEFLGREVEDLVAWAKDEKNMGTKQRIEYLKHSIRKLRLLKPFTKIVVLTLNVSSRVIQVLDALDFREGYFDRVLGCDVQPYCPDKGARMVQIIAAIPDCKDTGRTARTGLLIDDSAHNCHKARINGFKAIHARRIDHTVIESITRGDYE